MAGPFKKKQYNKPWILSTIQSKDRNFKSRVVKSLCRRSKCVYGSNVMLVSDGETSISAVFSDEAISGLADQGLGSSNWSTALLILQKYTLELKAQPGQDFGEYILYVKKFSIWDLQPGYQAKYDVKNCMEHEGVYDRLKEELKELKERAVCQPESSMTGSISLSQLLDEIARPSTCGSESQQCSEQSQESCTSGSKPNNMYSEQNSKCIADLTQSMVDRLMQPFSIEEFLIPTIEVSVLEKIEEWKPDYQPQQIESQSSPSEEQVESLIDQQFDVCAANTFSQDDAARFIATNPEKAKYSEPGNDVDYLGISFVSTPEEKEKKEEIVEREPLEPVCALFRLNEAEPQSQGTSCLWQEELESVQFSFEQETSAPDSQGSPEEHCRPKSKDSSMLKANPKLSDRSQRILAVKNIDMKSTSGFTQPNLKEKLLKCPQKLILTEEEQICINTLNKSPAEVIQKELLWESSNEVDVPLQTGKRLKETRIQEVEASRLVSHVDNLLPAEICKGTSNKSSVEECLEIGSPAAQSTQIDDAFQVMSGIRYSLKKSLKKGAAEELPENTDEKVIESSTGQSEISSQNSGHIYGSESISQVHNFISKISQDNSLPEIDSHKTSVKIQSFDKKHEIKDTSIDSTTNFSSQDVESSVLHNYQTRHSISPICNWDNVMCKLAEKKKELEALKYITERISDVTNKLDKSDGSERFDSQDITPNKQGQKNTGKEENGAEVSKEKGMCLNKSENNEIYDEGRYDRLQENSGEKVGNFVEIDSEEMELNNCFINPNKDIKKATHKMMDKNVKVNTQENSFETTETEYPVSSLSESETSEDRNDVPPPFRIGLSEAHLQKEEGFKCQRCENFKDSSNKKNDDQYSDQTDLEEIDETHQKCIIASSKEEKFVKVCSDKLEASSGGKKRQSLLGFPCAPEYFDTESGCKRRSERLYAKVLSCREKDIQVNGSEVSNTVLGRVFVKNDNRSDISRTEHGDEHVGIGEYDNSVLPHYDELDNCEETNPDMNVVNTELAAEVFVANSNEELSKSNLIEKTCDIKSRNQTKLTYNDGVNGHLTGYKTNTDTFTLRHNGNNIRSAFGTKRKRSNFVIDGAVIYDIRVVLERCDQLSKEKVKSMKNETGLNDMSEDCQLKDFTKLRSGKVTRREPVLEGSEGSEDNKVGHLPKENRPKISQQKTDSIAKVLEIEKVNKKDKIGSYLTRNRSDIEVLRKLKNSEIKKLCSISRKCETTSEPEKSENFFETVSYKKDEILERNADSVAIRRIESNKSDNVQTFEDQFKTWLGVSERKEGNGQYSLAYTKAAVQTVKIKNGQPENYEEMSCHEHVDPDLSENAKLTDSNIKSKGYIFDTNKDSGKDGSMENSDNSAKLSPFQTQPFDVCQYPETQEFSPELSENHLETSLNELFKHNSDPSDAQKYPGVDIVTECVFPDTSKAGNILKLKAHLIEDSECKDPVQKDLIRGYSLDKEKDGAKKSVNVEIKSAKLNDKNVKDREKQNCLRPDRTISTVSSGLQPSVSNEPPRLSDDIDGKNRKTLQNDTERVSVMSTSGTDEIFTKLIGKSEQTKLSSKQEISFLKVKPAQKRDIQRKRKPDESKINGIQKNKKLKCVFKESENKVETKNSQIYNEAKQDNEGMNEMNSSPDSFAEFKCSHKTPSDGKVKAASRRHLENEVIIIDKEKTKSLDKSVPLDRTNHHIKTYEPCKVFIDGHCFGNKVLWQNVIASPYGDSKCISKNKCCVEKTNKRKLSLYCSQESQSKNNGYKYQNASNETVNNKINTSSESLFSDDNDNGGSQSNSASLLQRNRLQSKECVAKKCVGKDAKDENLKHITAPHNEHKAVSTGSGELRYYKKDDISRFYRSKQKTHMKGQELDVSKQSNTAEKEKDIGHISFDRVLQNNDHQNLNLLENTGPKKSANKEQGSLEEKSKAKSDRIAKTALKNSEGTSIDKQMFIQDWLMKHREVSKEDPTCTEFSPPDISPPDSSLPSYQPIGITREPEICNEGQIVGNNDKKENSSDVTSTSESSSGSENEDSVRPLSAAAKYLMKLKTSRKKKTLLAFKSDMSNQTYDYLKSGDRL